MPKRLFFAIGAVLCLVSLSSGVFAGGFLLAQIKEVSGLVRVQDIDPGIVPDLRYATTNNFTGKKVYPAAVCLLRKETALKLASANKEFMKDGYRIKVFDAYRPPRIQEIFWEIMPDERYVANPHKGGSKHNRGGAVDITLIDQKGNELEMPSAFDDFTLRAARNNPDASPQARKNAEYLTFVMRENGFIPLKDEWWHFDDKDWKDFPFVDVNFEDFLEPSKKIKNLQDASGIPAVLQTLDQDTKQALVVRPVDREGFKAALTAWQLKDGVWQKAFETMEAVIGKNGFAKPNQKSEGDGKTPSGIFSIGLAFGYEPDVKTRLIAYRQATKDDFWVDDPDSLQYNQWVHGTPEAKSYERLKREDGLYKYAAVIEYNTTPVIKGKGSAIFLHVWRNGHSPTSGCVALSEENTLKLINWLAYAGSPVIILGAAD